MEGLPIYCSNSIFSFKKISLLPLYSSSTSSSGFTITSPMEPSTTIISPFCTCSNTPARATTAGISRALAKIALWDVRPPSSVTIPVTLAGSIPAVIEGVRSFARITEPSGSAAISTDSTPKSTFCILVLISRMSVALCCISSSPIEANISANLVQVVSIANSAFT